MANVSISIVGILFVAIGTVWSVWSVISANLKYIGTNDELANRKKDFIKQRKQVIGGLLLIGIGSVLQIIGVLLAHFFPAN